MKHFGSYLKGLRLQANIGLRKFAGMINMQPSNFSNIELGKVAPPKSKEIIDAMCRALGLAEESRERAELFDLSAEKSKSVPADIAETLKGNQLIPLLVRTIANKRLTDEKLKKMTEDIQKNYHRE